MRSKLIAFSLSTIFLLSGCAHYDDLGPLANFYHDCVGSSGPHQRYVRETLRRALAGDFTALHAVFTDHTNFGTGDNEAYTELPPIFLQTLGDNRYAAFAANQPEDVRASVLNFHSEQIPDFARIYPKTAKLALIYARARRRG